MKHEMTLTQTPFDLIKAKRKSVEIRLLDAKREKVAVGDTIIFHLAADPSQILCTKVTALHQFDTFQALFETLPLISLRASSIDEYKSCYKYYTKENESKYGVLGIELKLVSL